MSYFSNVYKDIADKKGFPYDVNNKDDAKNFESRGLSGDRLDDFKSRGETIYGRNATTPEGYYLAGTRAANEADEIPEYQIFRKMAEEEPRPEPQAQAPVEEKPVKTEPTKVELGERAAKAYGNRNTYQDWRSSGDETNLIFGTPNESKEASQNFLDDYKLNLKKS